MWHAGEPLVAGIEYYQRAFAIIDRFNHARVRISHSIQTNGTLLDRNWLDLFRQHGVKLGLSLDGPLSLHDRYRRRRGGGGSFETVMSAVRLLQHHKFPFHVITVLTRESLSAAHDLFRFYLDNEISDVAFNIEEIEGEHSRSSLQDADIAQEAKAFFRDFLALVEGHPGKIEVREFAGAFAAIANAQAADYANPQTEPMRIVTVGVNGELSTFSPELIDFRSDRYGSFVFGNVHARGLGGIMTDPNFAIVCADIRRGVEKCKASCEYFELCLGGAPANKLFENGGFDTTDTLYCQLSKQALIDVALERVERAAGLAA
jgi:uncharacterized protein